MPQHTFAIDDPDNLLALFVFVLMAVAVSWVVELAARRTREAARAGAQAKALATLSGDVLREERTLSALVARTRDFFALDGVRLLERVDGHDVTVAESGAVDGPGAVTDVDVVDGVRLRLVGRTVAAGDLRVLRAFSAQAAAALERRHLANRAEQAAQLHLVDRLRTSLLAAVGHDLRTPLAAAKAAVSSLRSRDVAWSEDERSELLATAEESLDQLDDVVSNLLDMSRLQAGALAMTCERLSLLDLLPQAVMLVPRPPSAPVVRFDDRSSSGHGAGVGLGLAVARGFVEAMGGTVTAEDTPGGGLTMTVSLLVARDGEP